MNKFEHSEYLGRKAFEAGLLRSHYGHEAFVNLLSWAHEADKPRMCQHWIWGWDSGHRAALERPTPADEIKWHPRAPFPTPHIPSHQVST